jgi:hypothetical protein
MESVEALICSLRAAGWEENTLREIALRDPAILRTVAARTFAADLAGEKQAPNVIPFRPRFKLQLVID